MNSLKFPLAFIGYLTLSIIPMVSFGQCASNATSTFDSRCENVQLAGNSITLNNNSSASGCVTYTDFTAGPNIPDLIPSSGYTINITNGTCGGNYTRYANAWIDFNNNGVFTDAGEMLGTGTTGNVTNGFVHSIAFTVPAGATLGNTTMRVILKEGTATASCGTYTYGETEDYTVSIGAPTPMSYTSSTCTQSNTTNVENCLTDVEVIGVEVVMAGSLTPLDITQLRLRTNGSTDPTNDVTNVDVYYTGTSSTFATTTFFGNVAPAATGTNMFVNGSQTLASGTNYFWVVYDLTTAGTVSNLIDAQCTRIIVDGTNRFPTTTAPAGSRTTDACTPTPGNLGTANLTAWFKPDALATGNVTSWTTSYPSGGSAITLSDGTAPYSQCDNTPTNNIFNYNSVVDFNGNTGTSQKQLMSTAAMNLLTNQDAASAGTFFNIYASPIVGNNDGVVTYKNGLHGIQMRGWGRLAIGANNSSNGCRNFTTNPSTQPLIISYSGNKSNATSMTAYRNDLIYTNSSGSSALMNTGLTFGAKRNSATTYNEYFTGFIGEVIFFNTTLSATDIQKVNTYTAIKYGVTLDNTGGGTQGDYLSTIGSTIWDASSSTGYFNNVIGIGRDDNEALLQKQSHSFDDSVRIYVSTLAATNAANAGSFASDISYIIMGDNQARMCNTTASAAEIPGTCSLVSRLAREWKVTRTNSTDNFNMDITLNSCAATASVNVSDLRFLVDDDGDFSNGGTTCYFNGDGSGLVFTYANPIITVSNISGTHLANNASGFITVGSVNLATPLPISMTDYSVKCSAQNPELTWETSQEINNDFFAIERSSNGSDFEVVGIVEGAGSSSTNLFYSWKDESPLSQTSFYRLTQTDFSGHTETFETLAAKCMSGTNINVYPNPFQNHITLNLGEGTNQQFDIMIMDAVGRVVFNEQIQSTENYQTINLGSELPAGAYFLNVKTAGESVTKKIVKTAY